MAKIHKIYWTMWLTGAALMMGSCLISSLPAEIAVTDVYVPHKHKQYLIPLYHREHVAFKTDHLWRIGEILNPECVLLNDGTNPKLDEPVTCSFCKEYVYIEELRHNMLRANDEAQ